MEPSIVKQSVMYVSPATVNGSTLARATTWDVAREPDRIAANYYSGAFEIDPRTGARVPPDDLARAASYIATANLPEKFCETHEVMKERFKMYMLDYSYAQDQTGQIRIVTQDIQNNPFGTRYGEVLAWRAINRRFKRGDKKADVALIQ